MPTRRFDAILFDLDDTLVPEMASEREALLATCALVADRGVDPAALAGRLDHHAGRLWGAWGMADHYRRIGYSRWEGLWGPFDMHDEGLGRLYEYVPDYRQQAWSCALADFGIRDGALVDQLIEALKRERLARLVPYPDAVPVLEALFRHYRLGIVTDGSPAVQRTKLAASGLERFFQAVAVSGETGACKPEPGSFMKVLAELGVPAGRAAMVGNNVDRDVLGAVRLGMYAVWVKRDGWPPGEAEPDAEVTALSQLPALLQP